ncbi:hypothetical protein D3C73_937070 [compost metagenome]
MGNLVLIHSDPRIGNADSHLILIKNSVQRDLARRGVFKGIINKNKHHLLQIVFVAEDIFAVQLAEVADGPVGLPRQEGRSAGDFSHHWLQRHRFDVKRPSGIGPGERQHVGNQTAHALGFVSDILHRFNRQLANLCFCHPAFSRVHLPYLLQQINISAYCCKRCPQLMRSIRYKAALSCIRVLKLCIEAFHPPKHAVNGLNQPSNLILWPVIYDARAEVGSGLNSVCRLNDFADGTHRLAGQEQAEGKCRDESGERAYDQDVL